VPPSRGNPYSDGGGARTAIALGGRVNTGNKGFYGHLWADGVQPIAPLDFIASGSGSGMDAFSRPM
jgi:hypothetical protein